MWRITDCRTPSSAVSSAISFKELVTRGSSVDLLFNLPAVLVHRWGPAKGVSTKEVFPFNILEFQVISHDSAEHSLKSDWIIFQQVSSE